MLRTHIDPAVKRLLVTMRQRTSAEHIYDLTDISVRTVQRTMQTYRETGNVVRKPVVTGRPRALNALDIAYLEALVERQPDRTLNELQQDLSNDLGVEVSNDTIRRSLLSRGLSRKKLSRSAYERDEEDRTEFQRIVGTFYRPDQIVCVDESATNRQTPNRQYGWAPIGDRARRRTYSIRGKNYSMLPAIALGVGVVHCNIYDTPVTSRLFNDFIEGLLDEMNPFPGPRSVILLDNASIHKSVQLREMVEARVTSEDVYGWYRHCNYIV
ncbi:unnamed protein product [Rhizoctonia solani]|nr:unnamed protein product [Rhizoctonia solani]